MTKELFLESHLFCLWVFWLSLKCSLTLTNSFHVVVHLFSNRSQMMSKCSMNKKVVPLMFSPRFVTEQTHGEMEFI